MTKDQQLMDELGEDRIWGGSFKLVCGVYFVMLIAFVLLRMTAGFGVVRHLPNGVLDVGFTIIVQIVIMTIIPYVATKYYFAKKQKSAPDSLNEGQVRAIKQMSTAMGFKKMSFKMFAIAVGLGFAMYLFNLFVASFFTGLLNIIGFRFSSGGALPWTGVSGLFIAMVMIAVLPGFCEEVTHRGFLQKSLNARLGVVPALFWTSLLFGLMHMNIVQFFYATILGFFIGLAVMATRNLWVGVILHFMNNGVGTYLSFANENGWWGVNFHTNLMDFVLATGGMFFIAAAVWGIYILMIRCIHIWARDTYKTRRTEHVVSMIPHDPALMESAGKIGAHLDIFIDEVEQQVARATRHKQLMFYIDAATILPKRKPVNLDRTEKILLYTATVLGSVVTVFTLVWGLL